MYEHVPAPLQYQYKEMGAQMARGKYTRTEEKTLTKLNSPFLVGVPLGGGGLKKSSVQLKTISEILNSNQTKEKFQGLNNSQYYTRIN